MADAEALVEGLGGALETGGAAAATAVSQAATTGDLQLGIGGPRPISHHELRLVSWNAHGCGTISHSIVRRSAPAETVTEPGARMTP